ncbi:hypothetical protein [Chitinophaga sp. CF418]|uniref:hypothetical protein n=1 Tax=Chitinophaga sp. CF418 TaxID=1855287 RepID=UPI0009199698|nr:hypothetical protein [Chitinophaga sp. CF418]SHN45897.1 hypothetical protein SAMN05216311_12219 [Chitinophaga sp. CF418]
MPHQHKYQLQAENEELKKQVAALTQALETEKRENQPYIKQLKLEADTYRIVIEQILLEMEYGQFVRQLPPQFMQEVAKIVNDRNIRLVVCAQTRGLSVYINCETAPAPEPGKEQ